MFGRCEDNAGSLRIVEPGDGGDACASCGLPAEIAAADSTAGVVGPNAGVQQLATGGTLVLRRMARLLSGASNPATEVTELKTGMLLFPTGSADGSMLNVEDEMGNKGGVPAAAVEIAQ